VALLDLGQALDGLDQDEEAEHVYRHTTLVSSNDWHCWVRLGNFLADQYFLAVPKNLLRKMLSSPSPDVLNYRPSSATLEKAEASLAEASQCFDHALSLAPHESEMFFQRAGFMSESNCSSYYIRHWRNHEAIDSVKWVDAFFSEETIANLQQAATLSPKNYQYLGLAVYFEFFKALAHVQPANPSFKNLPEPTQEFLRNAMIPLEDLTQNPDKKVAAGALEYLGFLKMMIGNNQAAVIDLRQAVALDPTREQSWDFLLAALKDTASSEELAAICETWLKIKNSANVRLLLGHFYVEMHQWDKASEQVEIARQLEVNNVIPPMMLAAIALEKSKQTNYFSIAETNFKRTNAIIGRLPTGDERSKRWREVSLNVVIFYALDDQPEAARSCANEILKHFPNDETVKGILNAMN